MDFSETDGIIFDLDGTLLDSMSVWENVDKDFLEENGCVYTPDVSEDVKKMTVRGSAQYFKERFDLKLSADEIIGRIEEMVSEKYHREIPLKEGVSEAVDYFAGRGIKMCVATATYNSLAYAALERLGIAQRLEFVITCQDVDAGKDKPDIFIEAAKRLGTQVNRTAVIEDSLHCIETAGEAGFFTVGVYDAIAESDWDKIKKTADTAVMDIRELLSP